MNSHSEPLAIGVLNRLIHEIATPLSVITFLAEEIKDVPGDRTRQKLLLCEQVIKNVDHIRSVLHMQVEQLADENSLIREPLELSDIAGDAIATMALTLRRAGVALDYIFEPLTGQILGNRTQILQVFINLISNGVEACSESLEKWVSVRIHTQANNCEFHICNGGVRLTREMAEQMLERPVSSKPGHRGLGISISQKILQSHGGSLRFEEAQAGTCFVVSLPLTKA